MTTEILFLFPFVRSKMNRNEVIGNNYSRDESIHRLTYLLQSRYFVATRFKLIREGIIVLYTLFSAVIKQVWGERDKAAPRLAAVNRETMYLVIAAKNNVLQWKNIIFKFMSRFHFTIHCTSNKVTKKEKVRKKFYLCFTYYTGYAIHAYVK